MPAKDVVDAFKRFDKDGNGQISLSELSFALQSLDPETWTEEAVKALMLEADKSGDGKMQIEEFTTWLFGEAKEAQGPTEDAFEKEMQQKGVLVGELFALFDADRDGYWNRDEANAWSKKVNGEPLEDKMWDLYLVFSRNAPDHNDDSKGLRMETILWFYLRPDMETFDIQKDYAIIFPKVQELANTSQAGFEKKGKQIGELFALFDRDGDRYWNHEEANLWSRCCVNGTPIPDDAWEMLLNAAKDAPEGNDNSMGLRMETVLWFYLRPDMDNFGDVQLHCDRISPKVKQAKEVFAWFDRDQDGYWNRHEANQWKQGCYNEALSDEDWEMHIKMTGSDVSKGLGLESMIWFYINPDSPAGVYVDMDHNMVFMKVQKAEEIFKCFDEDKDGYWNYQESVACTKVTEGESADQPRDVFDWLVNELTPAGEDKSLGISKQAVIMVYCHPDFSKFECKLDKDHDAVQAHKAKLAEVIFDHFDADGDGYWSYKEACACNQATSDGHPDMPEEEFKQMALRTYEAGEEPEKGFSKRLVCKMYNDARTGLDVMKDFALVKKLKAA